MISTPHFFKASKKSIPGMLPGCDYNLADATPNTTGIFIDLGCKYRT